MTDWIAEINSDAPAAQVLEQDWQSVWMLFESEGSDVGSDVLLTESGDSEKGPEIYVTTDVNLSDQFYFIRGETTKKIAVSFAESTQALMLYSHPVGVTVNSTPFLSPLIELMLREATATGPCFDDSVQAALTELAVLEDVSKAKKLCEKVYRTLESCEVCISEDPEIDDWTRVILDLKVSGSPETVLEDEKVFYRQLEPAVSNKAFALINVIYEWID